MAANMGTCSSTTTNSKLFSKTTRITHLIGAIKVKLIPCQKLEEFDRNVNLFLLGRKWSTNEEDSLIETKLDLLASRSSSWKNVEL